MHYIQDFVLRDLLDVGLQNFCPEIEEVRVLLTSSVRELRSCYVVQFIDKVSGQFASIFRSSSGWIGCMRIGGYVEAELFFLSQRVCESSATVTLPPLLSQLFSLAASTSTSADTLGGRKKPSISASITLSRALTPEMI